jgi:hypothetical protein
MVMDASYRKLDEITNRLIIQVQMINKSIQGKPQSDMNSLRKKIEEIQGRLEAEKPLFLHSPAKPLAGVKRGLDGAQLPPGKVGRMGTLEAGRRTRKQRRKPKH